MKFEEALGRYVYLVHSDCVIVSDRVRGGKREFVQNEIWVPLVGGVHLVCNECRGTRVVCPNSILLIELLKRK